jgi:hypothetical protein
VRLLGQAASLNALMLIAPPSPPSTSSCTPAVQVALEGSDLGISTHDAPAAIDRLGHTVRPAAGVV